MIKKKATERYNRFTIINLTKATDDDNDTDSFPLCWACEISMVKAGDNSYYCKGCGLVQGKDKEDDNTTTTIKKTEQIGPKIPSRIERIRSVTFKSINYTPTRPTATRAKSKMEEYLEQDCEREEEMLRAGGAIIADSYDEKIR